VQPEYEQGANTGRVLLLGLLLAPILGVLAGASVYLGARAVFQGGSYVSDSPWQSVAGLVGITVTAVVSVLVVRHYRIGPPWRTLVVVGSLAAIPALVVVLAWAALFPVFGVVIVALALVAGANWASQARAARGR
jgi:hypothetical protein